MKWKFWEQEGIGEPVVPAPEESVELTGAVSFEEESAASEAAPPPGLPIPPEPDTQSPATRPEASPAVTTCPECGEEIEADASFCPKCAAPMSEDARRRAAEAASGVEPWAYKTGQAVHRVPRWVKIWVPILLVVIVGAVVALLVISQTHSPEAAVERYLGDLQVGDTRAAYDLLVHPGGKFSSYEYFKNWQDLTTDNLGQLESYSVRERKPDTQLFGRLFDDVPDEGFPYVVTMNYKKQSFDVNITAEDAGGTWPVRRYRIKIADETTRVLAQPLGAMVYVDGYPVGVAKKDKDVEELLDLTDFPSDFSGIVEYVKKMTQAFKGQVKDVKQLMKDLDEVSGDAQRVFDRFGSSGVSWSEVLSAVESTISQSKDFATDLANLLRRVYWMFGGGDDGSLRADLTRVQSQVDLENLPEGYHEVKVVLPGAAAQTREFYAPEDVKVTLKPTPQTVQTFKDTMNKYYMVTSNAKYSLNTSQLSTVVDGELLSEINDEVLTLLGRGQRQASQLTSLEYKKFTLLSPTVATSENVETWNIITYQGSTPVSTVTGMKQTVVYTLKAEDKTWKVVERKVQ
ncbi:MAG: zinc ribbon domain-containing protein [Actinobacteria bacterium]|nr:zinc ribbon domain-containing protein [Actinomycetota bacterium]MBU1942985.1 zinc ribbon domain-containing protein [Actinomycetota bacterium]MBU2687774.1 zinc ribbon domain-containing protein [Actinomycetota bacterium]